jgi:catechol 2,3-dioxygenase-like lactoylglutathione lyase family enzyme
MTIELNHTIIWCTDKERSAAFLAEMLGLPAPSDFYHFKVVRLDNDVSLDFMQKDGPVSPQHYAFLIDEGTFDAVHARIQQADLAHWADPARSRAGEINFNDGGRGVYFEDPDGHLLEVLTRPYGSGITRSA